MMTIDSHTTLNAIEPDVAIPNLDDFDKIAMTLTKNISYTVDVL